MSDWMLFVWIIGVMYTLGKIAAKPTRVFKWYAYITVPLFCIVAWPCVLGADL
jgi:hypothetical protein